MKACAPLKRLVRLKPALFKTEENRKENNNKKKKGMEKMRSFRIKKNKKGVSPIIATLLLIVIAVAAAVVTYSFVTGFIGTATSQSKTQGQMSVDTGSVTNATSITLYVRDTGTQPETLSTVYVDGVLLTANTTVSITLPGTIAPNNVGTVIITDNTGTVTWNTGSAHEVKLVATDGTPVEYSVSS
jgi:flagellin-like protein